jgi:N-acetylglucosamine-6-phosphate deacetylase
MVDLVTKYKNAETFINGRFQNVDLCVTKGKFLLSESNLSEIEEVDCSGKKILPGFIDIHSHGCIGHDFTTASADEIKAMCSYYISNGITSILATTVTIEYSICKAAMITIRKVMETEQNGSRIIGINMEGPFLGKDKKGAHDERYLHGLDTSMFEELNLLSGDHIRIIDIDPNLEHAMEFIEKYSQSKIISLAHTSCSYDTAVQAIRAGATHITHLFNAMNGLHHREPGIIGAVSDYPVNAEIICDGIHIHPSVIRMMYKVAPDTLILISDSMCAAGLSDGKYELGGQEVFVKDKKATLRDNTIAGSTINVYSAFKNAINFGVPVEKAIISATINPAKAIRAEHEIGSITTGKKADFIIMDQNYNIEKVYKDGACVYQN